MITLKSFASRLIIRIPREDREEFILEMLRENLARLSGVSILLFFVELALYSFQENYYQSGYVNVGFLLSSLVLIPAIWLMKRRVRKSTMALAFAVQYAYCLTVLALGLLLALAAQPQYDLIHMYLLTVMGVTVFINMRPWRCFAMLSAAYLAFWFLLPVFQGDPVLLLTHRVNALIFNVISYIINHMMFSAKYTAYRGKKALSAKNEILQDLARRDAMTGLYNHEECISALERETLRAAETSLPMSLILIDIDDFKDINDTRGHLCGDEMIRRIAAALRASVRDTDTVGRYGGEEFMLILPGVALEGACALASRLSAAVQAAEVDGQRVTISGGICEYHGESLKALIGIVDKRLYLAKSRGKNHFVSQ